VTDYAAALPWYERFFGGRPSFLPNDTEAVWEVAGPASSVRRLTARASRPAHPGREHWGDRREY
jgi:hypothetical protein